MYALAPSLSRYLAAFVTLLALTAMTVSAAFMPLGGWHIPVALAIAAMKATLIFSLFMHGLDSGPLVWLTAVAALFFLAIMLSLTLADYWTRNADAHLRQLSSRSCGRHIATAET